MIRSVIKLQHKIVFTFPASHNLSDCSKRYKNKQNLMKNSEDCFIPSNPYMSVWKVPDPTYLWDQIWTTIQVFDKWPVNRSRLAHTRLSSRVWCRSVSPGFDYQTGIVGGPGVLRGSSECSVSQSNLFTTNTTSHLNWLKAFSSLYSRLLLAFLEEKFDYI